MASTVRILLKLATLVILIDYHFHASSKIQVAAELFVKPLWDIARNTTTPCSLFGHYESGSILTFNGSSRCTCSIHIRATGDSQTLLRLPNTSTYVSTIYVERNGDDKKDECTNRFVVIKQGIRACDVLFSHDDLKVYVQGDISLGIKDVPTTNVNFICPEAILRISQDVNVSESFQCPTSQVKRYNHQISCIPEVEKKKSLCRLDFKSNCAAILGNREVKLECSDNTLQQPELKMIFYPIDLISLYIGYNDITQIQHDSFLGLHSLRILNLEQNNLRLIPERLFHGLDLRVLIMRHNHLQTLEMYLFHGLDKLSTLDLSNNQLRILPPGLFSGLHNLTILTLNGNVLHNLPNGIFSDLINIVSLRLNNNQLQELSFGLFSEMFPLYELNLNKNKLKSLHQFTFSNLSNLHRLYLSSNQLQELPVRLFLTLLNLNELRLPYNNLKTLAQNAFSTLSNLRILDLYDNQLQELPHGLLSEMPNLKELYLSRNHLKSLHQSMFSNLPSLNRLYLDNNQLQELPTRLFSQLFNLNRLLLSYNNFSNLHPDIFKNLSNLRNLFTDSAQIYELPGVIFFDLHNLLTLDLDHNRLAALPPDIFKDLSNLSSLSLDDNKLSTIDLKSFVNLVNLEVLFLSHNRLLRIPKATFTHLRMMWQLSMEQTGLKHLDKVTFQGLVKLRYLYLANNTLNHLHLNMFRDCVDLIFLDLSFNQLKDIPIFDHLFNLVYLNLRHNPLTEITHKSFGGLPNATELLVGQHEICVCYTPPHVSCSASYDRSPYLTCERLLSDKIIAVFMWLIGLNAIIGNLFVMVWRRKTSKTINFQDMLLVNLALSDFLMGAYMLILASADIYFKDNFSIQADSWRSGVTCKFAGALSIISSEGSVFFVTFISIDRFIGIKYPMSVRKIGKKLSLSVIVATWSISLALGIVPSISAVGKNNFKFYDIPNVCIGLPLALTESYTTTESSVLDFVPGSNFFLFIRPAFSTKYEGLIKGMYFSTALFLGLNFVCYLCIMVCYIMIVLEVRKSSNRSGRTVEMKEQIKLTTKVSVIVATDFMCWFPIIIMGILVQSGIVTLPNVVYVWAVTVILPINSAINPYLYTIADAISKYTKKKQKLKKVVTVK